MSGVYLSMKIIPKSMRCSRTLAIWDIDVL